MRVIFLSSSNLLLRASRFYRHRSVSDVSDASGTSLRMTHHATSDLRMDGSTHWYGNPWRVWKPGSVQPSATANMVLGLAFFFFIACSYPFGIPRIPNRGTFNKHFTSLFIYYFVYCLFLSNRFVCSNNNNKNPVFVYPCGFNVNHIATPTPQ